MPCNMQGKGCLKGEAGGTEVQGLGTSGGKTGKKLVAVVVVAVKGRAPLLLLLQILILLLALGSGRLPYLPRLP